MTYKEETAEARHLACLDEDALKDITAPANLNSGELQDIYRLQTDDFDEPEALEVFYDDGKGGTVREIVFIDPIYAERRPRICVSIDGIQAMHNTISCLTRKVDNLVATLAKCRSAYYKELTTLKEQLYQQALARKDGRKHSIDATVLFDPSAFQSQTSQEVEMEVKRRTEKLTKRLTEVEVENLRLKKRIAILTIEVTQLENQMNTRVQKMDVRDMLYDILDRVKVDTLVRTLRSMIEDVHQELFCVTLEEVLSDFRGLKVGDMLKQSADDAEKISRLGGDLLKVKQEMAQHIRDEKQAQEALMQTTRMWQESESLNKDLEQSLEESQVEAADWREKAEQLIKEPAFLREKMAKMREEQQQELEALRTKLKEAQKAAEKSNKTEDVDLATSLSMSGKQGSKQFADMADMVASTQQGFNIQEQFTIALSLLKGCPSSQVTKTADIMKALVEDTRPNLMKELLASDHGSLGPPKVRLGAAQKLLSGLPQEDQALVADLLPPKVVKEITVKVLEDAASDDAADMKGHAGGYFDPNIDISKRCKKFVMTRLIKKLNSQEVKVLFDELGQRTKKAILIDIFDYQDPKDLELCAEMIFVEPSVKAFVKGLCDEANELFLLQTAHRIGQAQALALVAPDKVQKEAPRAIQRHHETVQTEFSCVSEELILEISRKAREEDLMQQAFDPTGSWMVTQWGAAADAPPAEQEKPGQTERDATEAVRQAEQELEALEAAKRAEQEAAAAIAMALAEKQEALEQAQASAAAADAAREEVQKREEEMRLFKEQMEQELQEAAARARAEAQAESGSEGQDEELLAQRIARAQEQAAAAAEAAMKEKEAALLAAQQKAEQEAATASAREQAAADAAAGIMAKEAEAQAARERAEQQASVQLKASTVANEEAARTMAQAQAVAAAAQKEREAVEKAKAAWEARMADEAEALKAAEKARDDALAAAACAEVAFEAAAGAVVDVASSQMTEEERQALQERTAKEREAKEQAEAAVKKAAEALQAAKQRAEEAENQSREAAISAQFKALGKLSRVQAAYATLEERLKIQEEATAQASKREEEAVKREEKLATLVAAKALAKEVNRRNRAAQTLLAIEQETGSEKWRLALDVLGDGPDQLRSDVRLEIARLATQWLAQFRLQEGEESLQESVGNHTLSAMKDFVDGSVNFLAVARSVQTTPQTWNDAGDAANQAVQQSLQELASMGGDMGIMAQDANYQLQVVDNAVQAAQAAKQQAVPAQAHHTVVVPTATAQADVTVHVQQKKQQQQQQAAAFLLGGVAPESVQVHVLKDPEMPPMALVTSGGASQDLNSMDETEQRHAILAAAKAVEASVTPSSSSTSLANPPAFASTSCPPSQAFLFSSSSEQSLQAGISQELAPASAPYKVPTESMPPVDELERGGGHPAPNVAEAGAAPSAADPPALASTSGPPAQAKTASPSKQAFQAGISHGPGELAPAPVEPAQRKVQLPSKPVEGSSPRPTGPTGQAGPHAVAAEPVRNVVPPRKSSVEDLTRNLGLGAQTDHRLSIEMKPPLRRPSGTPSRHKKAKHSTSRRLLHLKSSGGRSEEAITMELGDVAEELELESKMLAKHMAVSIGKAAGLGHQSPHEAALTAAASVHKAMMEKGVTEEEAVEFASFGSGLAASEAAIVQGTTPEAAASIAAAEAQRAALVAGCPTDLALQCGALAIGAVVAKLAAQRGWKPSDAATMAGQFLKRFVDANSVASDHFVAMTAMATHEAAEAVALANGFAPRSAAEIGAEEASRMTSQLLHAKIRGVADDALRNLSAGTDATSTSEASSMSKAASGFSAIQARPSDREQDGMSPRQGSAGTQAQNASKPGLTEFSRRPLPVSARRAEGDAALPAASPREEQHLQQPQKRPQRMSIADLTLPALPSARRMSQAPTAAESNVSSVAPNEKYPETSRILSYGQHDARKRDHSRSPSPAVQDVQPVESGTEQKPSARLLQEFRRPSMLSMQSFEVPLPVPPRDLPVGPVHSNRPKLQGWQRLQKPDEASPGRGRRNSAGRSPHDDASLSSPERPNDPRSDPVSPREADPAPQDSSPRPALEDLLRPKPPSFPIQAMPPEDKRRGARDPRDRPTPRLRGGPERAEKVHPPRDGEKAQTFLQALEMAKAQKQREGAMPKPPKREERSRPANIAAELRVAAIRSSQAQETSPSKSRRRASLLNLIQPESKKADPFAPDVNALYVGAGQPRQQASPPGSEVASRVASKANMSPSRVRTDADDARAPFGGVSPSTSMHRDPRGPEAVQSLQDVLSVSVLSTDSKGFAKPFKPLENEAPDDSGLEADALEALPRKAESRAPRSSRSSRSASREPPKRQPPEQAGSEAEVLVKRVQESLDRKFGSVDAAFMNMSARMNRLSTRNGTEGEQTAEEKEDRALMDLRQCMVESGVSFKDATLFLQAMRSSLGGAPPSVQDVANSLMPGHLLQDAVDQAKKKTAFSLSGSDDPNINLDNIQGISNLNARSILERPGAPVVLPTASVPAGASSRSRSGSQSPGKRSERTERSHSRSPSKPKAPTASQP